MPDRPDASLGVYEKVSLAPPPPLMVKGSLRSATVPRNRMLPDLPLAV